MTSDLARRRVAWEALSELFLDTEPDLEAIARRLGRSGFDVAELDHILRGEVAPVLGGNLLAVAGVWDAFDLEPIEARYRAGRRRPGLLGRLACHLIRDDWARVRAGMEGELR
ncbi:DUF7079 family protein [Deinococcus koreensis]|uniref:DUF7079 domain-containing protein n=1 Tax=Deinococcus koreensis TaxID=2054903 RepID=A0A2K3UY69_9DEIO|nr:hypothetical protein [Deinococcus koreensis]PNY81477.1 hypothetical protein CVO96_08870 [Deinococcus koreensis]